MGSELKRFLRHQKLPLIRHKIALERSYPESVCELRKNVLTWRASIVPTPLSRAYCVRIVYDGHSSPRVVVSGESLRGLSRRDFPHKYDIDKKRSCVRVCLFLPFELDYMKTFDETIVPWTAEWLLHYEIWLATGVWCGGGEHPVVGKKRPFAKKIIQMLIMR